MASRVKGIVVEIGGDTTGLDKALSNTNKQIGTTQRSLKDVERLLKLDPKNTTLLAQKQRLLGDAVSNTKDKLSALQNAEKQVQEQFKKGKVSQDQYDALQREIVDTQQALRKAEKEAADFEAELKGIDEKPIRDVDDAAEDAKESLKEAGDEASTFGDMLKAQLSADAIKEIGSTLKDVAEESKEYRKIMGSLDISSQKAGYAADETSQAYKRLYGVLGDEQSAATTLANLQAIGLSQNELLELIDSSVGAWAQYGDSIPIDGLSEAINETIKTGQVTGVLADVLNWGAKAGETYGVAMRAATEENEDWNKAVEDAKTAEDYFNLALQDCATDADRANKVLQMLSNQGLSNSGKAWQQNNKSLVENNIAQAELQEQFAQLGETVEPIFTKITSAISSALAWFNSLDSGMQNTILIIAGVVTAIATLGPVVSGLSTVFSGLGSVMSIVSSGPAGLIIVAIAAIVAGFIALWNNCEGFRNFWIGLWEGIKSTAIAAREFIDTKVLRPIVDAMNGLWVSTKSGVNGFLGGIESFINNIIGGVNWLIGMMNKVSFDVPDWVPLIGGKTFGFNIPEIGKVKLPKLATGGEVLKGSAIVGEAGPELLTVAPGRTIVQPLSNNTTNHNSTSLGGVYITVYGAPGQDVRALAGIIMEEMQYAYDSKEAAL